MAALSVALAGAEVKGDEEGGHKGADEHADGEGGLDEGGRARAEGVDVGVILWDGLHEDEEDAPGEGHPECERDDDALAEEHPSDAEQARFDHLDDRSVAQLRFRVVWPRRVAAQDCGTAFEYGGCTGLHEANVE